MDDLPFLDLTRPGFSTRGPEVMEARRASWVARTPFGLAVLRHHEAGRLLRDRRLRQGSHAWPRTIGLKGSFARFWEHSIIGQEGAGHKTLRRIAQAALAPAWIDSLRPQFRAHAAALPLTDPCDFMADFATPFAGLAMCTVLGLPETHWRDIAEDATVLGRAMGIDAKTHEAAVNAAYDRLADCARIQIAGAKRGEARGCIARMNDCADSTGLDEQSLIDLIVITIFGGVDTTRAQLGLAINLFCDHPDQWAGLRGNPDLIPQAIEETLRSTPTTTWSTRETLERIDINGLSIPKNTTIHILTHATATDAAGHDGRFDITALRKIHFGFGGGAHHCLGQGIARVDMAQALGVLAQRIPVLHRAGAATFLPETGNTGPITLPLRIDATQMTKTTSMPVSNTKS